MEATESASKPDEAKIAILLYLIVDEGQDIFETFAIPEENAKNFEAVMQAFDTYCVPKKKKNESVCRHIFFQRAQKEGEPIEEFITELKRLSYK